MSKMLPLDKLDHCVRISVNMIGRTFVDTDQRLLVEPEQLVRHICSAGASYGLPRTKDMWEESSSLQSPVKGHKDESGKSSEHASFEEKLRELELLSLQNRSIRGILSICRNIIGGGRNKW